MSDAKKYDLPLERCPHCRIAKPRLEQAWEKSTSSHDGRVYRKWNCFICSHCGGVVLTSERPSHAGLNQGIWPASFEVDESVPERARTYLAQAIDSIHAPAGSVMLAASAVDAMLKAKGLTQGNLYSRIEKAAADHLITADMSAWAHEVRLDANDQRHADESIDLPTEGDAERVVEFAKSLAQFLFVLPARVARGRGKTATS